MDSSELLEARREAVPVAVLAALALVGLTLLSRIHHWRLVGSAEDWWVWLVLALPVALLALDLASGVGSGRSARTRRRIAIVLISLVVAGNLTGLGLLVGTLVARGSELHAGQLLVTGLALLVTSISTFGIALWELDCGGPVARASATARRHPDLQFPQDENAELAAPDWRPHALDYLYVSLTNSIAFSPTDTMPLTRRAKGVFAVESFVSAVTVLLVAARAVNVF